MNPYKYNATVVRVVDGDTIDFDVDLGFHITHRIRTRLLGVDTPEKYGRDACEEGREASKFVEGMLPVGTKVSILTTKTGKYGRWLAEVITLDFGSLNQILRDRYGDY